jgi:alkanesulfonate monooxygenase
MERLEFSWYIPNDGDGEHVGTWLPEIMPTLDNLTRVVQSAEAAGFDTVLVPTGQQNNTFSTEAPYIDSVVSASAMAAVSKRIKLLTAIRTGLMDPAVCARLCATLDLLSNGRFLINVVSGGAAIKMYGEELDHDARYRRTAEQIAILKGLWTQPSFSYEGEFYRLENAICFPKPVQQPHPPMYFAGSSEIARDIGAREADCMLIHGEAVEKAAAYAADVRQRAERYGRSVRVGIRFQIIARETEAEAHEAAERLLSRVDPRIEQMRKELFAASEAIGQRNLGEQVANDMLGRHLWGGMRRVRSGAGTGLLGSYEQVARVIRDYAAAGMSLFIFSGYPMADEAARVGEHVLPLVQDALVGAR